MRRFSISAASQPIESVVSALKGLMLETGAASSASTPAQSPFLVAYSHFPELIEQREACSTRGLKRAPGAPYGS
jgi:hypothetical protein